MQSRGPAAPLFSKCPRASRPCSRPESRARRQSLVRLRAQPRRRKRSWPSLLLPARCRCVDPHPSGDGLRRAAPVTVPTLPPVVPEGLSVFGLGSTEPLR